MAGIDRVTRGLLISNSTLNRRGGLDHAANESRGRSRAAARIMIVAFATRDPKVIPGSNLGELVQASAGAVGWCA
jgi:hypothetical protein